MVKYLDRFNIIDLTEVDFKIGTCSGATISEFEVWRDATLAEQHLAYGLRHWSGHTYSYLM